MQKLGLNQSLSQKLSPQQIQFIKLLQVPTVELDARLEEELADNPALEDGKEADETPIESEEKEFEDPKDDSEVTSSEDISLEEYMTTDDYGYKMQGDGPSPDDDDRDMPLATHSTLIDALYDQLGYTRLTEKQIAIGKQLIGTLDEDGYMRRDLEAIANDMAFTQNIIVSSQEVEVVLKTIQQFDPPGIAARDLQECLTIQLKRKDANDPIVHRATKLVTLCFNEFSKKHYEKIMRRLSVTSEELKEAIEYITKLDPRPGGANDAFAGSQVLYPDFMVREVDGELHLSLNSKNAPDLRISKSYREMFETYDKAKKKDKSLKETVSFVKQKLDSAKWFIDAIKQRQETLFITMKTIMAFQYDFFLTDDDSKLKPMILKDVAEKINMDISTVSRVVNSKSVQTDYGIYPLKFFFSESISTDSGEDVSSKEVKATLRKVIEEEDKKSPLSDDSLVDILNAKGYNIARRTVAKYRKQLNIPVARLRKEL